MSGNDISFREIKENIDSLEDVIGYRFKNRDYVLEALTHSSYSNENKNFRYNERMEFLGDSVLGIVISDYIFKKETSVPEGELTKLRANIVCEESLSRAARKIDLGSHLLLGKGEEITGGRERKSILADAFEALIASIYLDGGMEPASKFILSNLRNIIKDSIDGKMYKDYKTQLQEELQKNGASNIWYRLIEEIGPDHNKTFVMMAGVNEKSLGSGSGKSKKEAEQDAARAALENIFGKSFVEEE
ncbi:ribonuclease III [Peptacetobacter hominis]|uniref:Ribonuclease 3 n=1 Tax=Peptacetobacter hominis TaxID=2743610 RepID=A0A544QVB4_9FIRM|nr:ribonuclease III [Peptacetobacter hominis]TQQ84633.1 ribonuclease III [Peptacetobacter hominis]